MADSSVALKPGKSKISCLLVTPRASPATTANREEQHIQLIRNKENAKIQILIGPGARGRF
jgi:hypothetical protein